MNIDEIDVLSGVENVSILYLKNLELLEKLGANPSYFNSDETLSAICVNFNPTVLELMKYCAEHYTSSREDYHIVMTFIESLSEKVMEVYGE